MGFATFLCDHTPHTPLSATMFSMIKFSKSMPHMANLLTPSSGFTTNLNAAALQQPRTCNTLMNIEFSMPAMSKLLSTTSLNAKVADASKLTVPKMTFFTREFRSWLPRLKRNNRLQAIPEGRELDVTMDKILASSCRFGTPRASVFGKKFSFLERIAKKAEGNPSPKPSAPEPKPSRATMASSTLLKHPCNACIGNGSEEEPTRASTREPQSLEDVSFLLQDVIDTPESLPWGYESFFTERPTYDA